MSFQIQDIEEINTISQTLLYLNPYISFTVGDYKMSVYGQDNGFWLLCDGRSLEISSYPYLYNVISDSFGSVDSEHFNLPDFRARVAGYIGGGTGLSNRTLGEDIGAETHTLTIPEIPSHVHTGTTDTSGEHIHSITDPGHTHTYVNQPNTTNPAVSLTTTDVADNVNVNQTTSSSTTGITVNSAGSHVHTFTTNATGGSGPHNNMQPTLFGGNMFILSKPLTNSFINSPAFSI